jgi:cytochrome c
MIDRRTLLGFLGLFACAGGTMASALARAEERGTPDEAKEMVASAIALYRAEGKAAFDIMNRGAATGFLRGDLYIFVSEASPDGKVVVQAFDNGRIGLRVDDIKDADGKPFGREMRERATPEGVWVDYSRMDPITKKDQAKSSWVVRYGDYIFGCGVYKSR